MCIMLPRTTIRKVIPNKHGRLSKSNTRDSHLLSYPSSSWTLPRSLRKFGLHSIWIDSLCIIQDDENDWLQEASQMADLYMHAEVTIFAHCAQDEVPGFESSCLQPKVPVCLKVEKPRSPPLPIIVYYACQVSGVGKVTESRFEPLKKLNQSIFWIFRFDSVLFIYSRISDFNCITWDDRSSTKSLVCLNFVINCERSLPLLACLFRKKRYD